jgi:alkanesulfonate monooxygenase SsuD/methylene tetrahydromethanopterin reductase-like flavin-dependent oxidoreductase (luciferase family)
MIFGLVNEHQTRKPWTEGSEHRIIWDSIAQIMRAEEVGFEYVWQVEHHFLPEFSHSSANDIFLAAVAQHTKTIRMGLGVVLMPAGFNHPFKIAERVATLDNLSNGRVDFGMGRSITTQELLGFGIQPGDAKPMLLEAARIVPQMWRNEVFPGHEGRYYQLPERHVVPKPLQKPSPPMWMAAGSPESFEQAGQLGVGLLCFVLTDGTDIAPKIQRYKDAIAKCTDPVAGEINEHVGVFQITHCAETAAEAREVAGESALFYGSVLGQFFGNLGGFTGYEAYKALIEAAERRIAGMTGNEDPVQTFLNSGQALVGTPDDILDRIAVLKDAGADQIIMLKQFGNVPHENILRSIDLIGKRVIPYA